MAKDWIERKNDAFLTQAAAFSKTLSADYAAYGISSADTALLADDVADFRARQALASRAETRTSVAVAARNMARRALTARMRDIAGRIRANSSVGTALRVALGLSVRRGEAGDSSDSSDATRPVVYIKNVVNNLLMVRLADEQNHHRLARPRDVAGAELFFAAGDVAPTAPEDWRHAGLTMSSKATLRLPLLPPGAKVWVCARWFDSRGRGGLLAQPVSTRVGEMTLVPTGLREAA